MSVTHVQRPIFSDDRLKPPELSGSGGHVETCRIIASNVKFWLLNTNINLCIILSSCCCLFSIFFSHSLLPLTGLFKYHLFSPDPEFFQSLISVLSYVLSKREDDTKTLTCYTISTYDFRACQVMILKLILSLEPWADWWRSKPGKMKMESHCEFQDSYSLINQRVSDSFWLINSSRNDLTHSDGCHSLFLVLSFLHLSTELRHDYISRMWVVAVKNAV